jgi:hypothetical protein
MRTLIVVSILLVLSGPGWSGAFTESYPWLHTLPLAAAQGRQTQPDDPLGVCCVGSHCRVFTEQACLTAGGEWDGSTCDCFTHNCLDPDYAPCCIPDWFDCLILREEECLDLGGYWLPWCYRCERPDPCIQSDMPCCFGMDECIVTSEQHCLEREGLWLSGQTASCEDCAQHAPQACCIGSECVLMWDAWLCANRCGVFQPGVYTCDPNPCEPTSFVSEVEPRARLTLSVVPNPVTGGTHVHQGNDGCGELGWL